MNDAPLSPDEDLPKDLNEGLDADLHDAIIEGAIEASADSEPAVAAVPVMPSGPTAAEMAAAAAAALDAALAERDPSLRGRSVLVVGLGESGLAMARWASLCGAQVTVADSREAPPQLAKLTSACP